MKECCKYQFALYHEGYDSKYCPFCDTWLERACQDDDCGFCSNRPDRPSETKNYAENTLELILDFWREVRDEHDEETEEDCCE